MCFQQLSEEAFPSQCVCGQEEACDERMGQTTCHYWPLHPTAIPYLGPVLLSYYCRLLWCTQHSELLEFDCRMSYAQLSLCFMFFKSPLLQATDFETAWKNTTEIFVFYDFMNWVVSDNQSFYKIFLTFHNIIYDGWNGYFHSFAVVNNYCFVLTCHEL